MTWKREPKAVNDKPSYSASTDRAAWRIIPVAGGFRLHWLPKGESTWHCGRWDRKLAWVKMVAGEMDKTHELR